jgi:hypothetical protein
VAGQNQKRPVKYARSKKIECMDKFYFLLHQEETTLVLSGSRGA